MMEKTNKMLERLQNALSKRELLSQWEQGFLESLLQQFNKHGRLSSKQVEVLQRVETQKLSAAAQDARKAWDDNYDDEKRRIALICAQYYAHTGYFTNLADSIIHDPGYIPTEKAWKKMCENKYAKKVIAEHDAPPKYTVGSVVEFRSTADWSMKHMANGMPCVVISCDGNVLSAAKGAKPYKVLPYGTAKMISCEERHLKKCKNPKKKSIKFVDNDVPF